MTTQKTTNTLLDPAFDPPIGTDENLFANDPIFGIDFSQTYPMFDANDVSKLPQEVFDLQEDNENPFDISNPNTAIITLLRSGKFSQLKKNLVNSIFFCTFAVSKTINDQ